MATLTATPTKTFHAEASALIDASPAAIHAIIADYRVGHPAILPKPYFTELTVEKGGFGAGTVIHVGMKVWGRSLHFHQSVSEPEPGRTLDETDMDTGQFTRFTFEPVNGRTQTRVTIASEFPVKAGIMGWLEKMTQPSVARRLYQQELRNLAEYVAQKEAAR
jgi:hypothetical protein